MCPLIPTFFARVGGIVNRIGVGRRVGRKREGVGGKEFMGRGRRGARVGRGGQELTKGAVVKATVDAEGVSGRGMGKERGGK